jgi:glycosyltransferase involved in cell wall biosynthesis
MRVALIGPGESTHTAAWLDELSERGHEALAWLYPPISADFGKARHIEPVLGRGPVGRWSAIRRLLRHERPDLVTQHYMNTDTFAVPRMTRRPFVVSIWGSDLLRDLERSALRRWMVLSGLRRAALVISPAGHVTERLFGLGVARDRIVTAQYGVDMDRFSPGDEPVPTAPRVVCARAFKPIYGIEDVVRAIPMVSEEHVAGFEFVGDGPLRADLESLAERVAPGRARFHGFVDHEGLAGLLRRGDIYVSMSHSDGTSLSLLEAMASGLVPVLSDIPANREWIENGVDGLLVPVGDSAALAEAIGRAAEDRAFRESASGAVRRKVEERGDRAKNVARIVDALETLVEEPDARAIGRG